MASFLRLAAAAAATSALDGGLDDFLKDATTGTGQAGGRGRLVLLFFFAGDGGAITLKQSSPTLKQSSPALKQSSPALKQSSPALKQSSPALNQSSLALNQSSPALNQSSPTLNQLSPTLNQSLPTLNQSLPTIKATVVSRRHPKQSAAPKTPVAGTQRHSRCH